MGKRAGRRSEMGLGRGRLIQRKPLALSDRGNLWGGSSPGSRQMSREAGESCTSYRQPPAVSAAAETAAASHVRLSDGASLSPVFTLLSVRRSSDSLRNPTPSDRLRFSSPAASAPARRSLSISGVGGPPGSRPRRRRRSGCQLTGDTDHIWPPRSGLGRAGTGRGRDGAEGEGGRTEEMETRRDDWLLLLMWERRGEARSARGTARRGWHAVAPTESINNH